MEHDYQNVKELLYFILTECGDMKQWYLEDFIDYDYSGHKGKKLYFFDNYINNERLLYGIELSKKYFNENIIYLDLPYVKELEPLDLSDTLLERVYIGNQTDDYRGIKNFSIPKLPTSLSLLFLNDCYFTINKIITDSNWNTGFGTNTIQRYKLSISFDSLSKNYLKGKEYFSNNKEELIKIIEDYNDF